MSIIDLPEAIYGRLLEAARQIGVTPEDWIAIHLPAQRNGSRLEERPEPTEEEIARANARLRATRITREHRTNTDNAGIDADLLREYGDAHSILSHSAVENK